MYWLRHMLNYLATKKYIVEVGLLGQIHIRVGSVMLEEAEKIAEFNSTLIVIDVNILVA